MKRHFKCASAFYLSSWLGEVMASLMDCIRCLILNPSLFCRCFKNSFSSFSRFSLQNKETIHIVAMFYFYTTFYSSVCVENALIYHYQMTQTKYIYFIKATRKAILAARERQCKTFCSTQQEKNSFELCKCGKVILLPLSRKLYLVFSYYSLCNRNGNFRAAPNPVSKRG